MTSYQTDLFSQGTKSFLRWAGSKRRQLGFLERYFTDRDKTYIEPFAGSSALFFRLAPSKAILADLNSHLINTMRQVARCPTAVSESLRALPRSSDSYYQVREAFNRKGGAAHERAIQFIYLNRNCFNGLWRTDTKGRFNVPCGGAKAGDYPSPDVFRACASRLRKAKLLRSDFRDTLKYGFGPKNFIYLDPPYFARDERVFVEYGEKTFGADDLEDMLDLLDELDRSGAKFVLSYKDDPYVRQRCRGWHVHSHAVMRNVGGFSSTRRRSRELIVSNVRLGAD